MRKNLTLAFFALFCALTAAAQLHNDDVHVHEAVSRQNYRQYLRIPDIGGYITLKAISTSIPTSPTDRCGPSARVNEAWNDGLDAIAMTDHIEVHKNADIIRCGLNKPYELAKARGDMIGMIVIPGAEITRKKPLGHICTLFIQDAVKLDVEDEMQGRRGGLPPGRLPAVEPSRLPRPEKRHLSRPRTPDRPGQTPRRRGVQQDRILSPRIRLRGSVRPRAVRQQRHTLYEREHLSRARQPSDDPGLRHRPARAGAIREALLAGGPWPASTAT